MEASKYKAYRAMSIHGNCGDLLDVKGMCFQVAKR